MLAFTRQEQGIVLFLIITLLLGSGVELYQRFFGRDSVVHSDQQRSETFELIAASLEAEDLVRAREGESVQPKNATEAAFAELTQIDINSGEMQDLMRIPNVGQVLAQRIIDYRIQNGKFDNIEQLKNIKGIGTITFEKMRPFVCLK